MNVRHARRRDAEAPSAEHLPTRLPLLACALALACTGCGFFGPPECPEKQKTPIEPGTYVRSGDNTETAQLHHGELESPTVRVDRDKDVVEVTYQRDGEEIVETWAITDAEFR